MSANENHPTRGHHFREGCRLLGIGPTKGYELLKSGTIRTIKIGGRRIITDTEIARLLSEGTGAHGADAV